MRLQSTSSQKKGGEKVIKDVFKKKRWAFEYEIEKNLGIIPVNLI